MVDPYYPRETTDAREEPADCLQQVRLPDEQQPGAGEPDRRDHPSRSIGQHQHVADRARADQQPADRVPAAGPEGTPYQPVQRGPPDRDLLGDARLLAPDDAEPGAMHPEEEVQVAGAGVAERGMEAGRDRVVDPPADQGVVRVGLTQCLAGGVLAGRVVYVAVVVPRRGAGW